MDDPKETQDTSQTEDTSGETKGTSEDPGTFNKESQEKAVSDALSAAGRDAKTITEKSTEAQNILDAAQKVRTDTKAEQDQWQKDRDEAAREAVRDDPEALKSLEEKQRQRNEAAKLADRKQELDAKEETHKTIVESDLETIRVHKRTTLAAEVAVAKNVSVDDILAHTKDDTREAMEAIADTLVKVSGKKPLKTDPGETIGGRSFKDLSPKDKVTRSLEKLDRK